MGTYKNDYTKEEDEALWEHHEIRRTLNRDLKNKSVEEINKDALQKFEEWKRQAEKINEIAS